MRARVLVAGALLALATGCDMGDPASPTFGPALDATVAATKPVVCPPDIDATFGSIYSKLLSNPSAVNGCGTASALTTCHSTKGASGAGAGNLLDFSLDAGAVYAELLGPDGGGHLATNEDTPKVHVLRVAPYEAGASMLYIKITLDASSSADYGSGMPLNAPGSVCPATVAAVADWINAGAPR
jgi:hypothetical protein